MHCLNLCMLWHPNRGFDSETILKSGGFMIKLDIKKHLTC